MPAPIGPVPARPATPTVTLTTAAKSWAEGFNFGSASAVGRIDVPRATAGKTGPESLQRA